MSDDDDARRLHDMVGDDQQEPVRQDTGVLDYQRPQPRRKDKRGASVGKGIAWVWACVIVAIISQSLLPTNGFITFFGILIVGGIAGFVSATFNAANNGQAGFFVGLVLGVLTVIGVVGLLLAVFCGGLRR
jgi:hypothetical protein